MGTSAGERPTVLPALLYRNHLLLLNLQTEREGEREKGERDGERENCGVRLEMQAVQWPNVTYRIISDSF